MFLKLLDDSEKLLEADAVLDKIEYKPTIKPPYRWRDWAANEDFTSDKLKSFINNDEAILPDGNKDAGLLAHGFEYPDINDGNSLRFTLSEIGEKNWVDVILTNPPFGGEEEDRIKNNFPIPEGRKTYTKTKPIQDEDFAECVAWWQNREENQNAWKYNFREVYHQARADAVPFWDAGNDAEETANNLAKNVKELTEKIKDLENSILDFSPPK